MKYLLLLLLLANLVAGLWWYNAENDRRARDQRVPQLPGGELVLLSEMDRPPAAKADKADKADKAEKSDRSETADSAVPAREAEDEEADPEDADTEEAESPAKPEPAPEPETVEKPAVCITLGPFVDSEEARRAVKLLSTDGAQVSWRSATEQVPSGYRVFIAPLENSESAYELAAELRDRGVDDNFVITNPNDKVNGISLGLFTQKRGAIKRLARLRNLGYEAEIEVRYRDSEIQWVDYEGPRGESVEQLLREATEGVEDVQRIQRDCERR
ncbi:MAG: SPOR domain-containing protein [Pseudomonadota bacterium]